MLSTIKPSPEEWRQVVSTMRTRPNSRVKPIECHVNGTLKSSIGHALTIAIIKLFIPSSQIYGVSDAIPFHVQLAGPLSSLLAFLPSYSDATSSLPPEQSVIRVFLLRQVLVEVRGQKGWRNCELGDGKLRALPPAAANATTKNDEEVLDWEGEVRCREDITVGGFNIGKLVVKVGFLISFGSGLLS
jgi:hypothetical protein